MNAPCPAHLVIPGGPNKGRSAKNRVMLAASGPEQEATPAVEIYSLFPAITS